MAETENSEVTVDIDGEGKEETADTQQNPAQDVNEEVDVVGTDFPEERPIETVETPNVEPVEETPVEVTDTIEGVEEGEHRKKHKKHKKDKKNKKDKKHKKKKRRSEDGSPLVEKEAELDEEEGVAKAVSEDEEDESGLDEYDTQDGFIADDLEEDVVGEGGEQETKKRRKKKRKKDYQLDEEDLTLIEDASGVRLSRNQEEAGPDNRPFKRIKKKTDESQPEHTDIKLQLQSALFGGEPEEDEEPERPMVTDDQDIDVDADEDDDIDQFIEHVNEFGQPIQKPRMHRKARVGGISNAKLREAEEIFGDDFLRPMEEEEEIEKGKKPLKLEEAFDPDALKEHFMTPEDEEIRVTDTPERLQLRLPNRPVPDHGEIKDEAEWIYNRNFANITELPIQVVVPKIVYVLEFLRNQNLEIPFIYHYRKDYYSPELDLWDLWQIYDWDEKWAHLQARKTALKSMYEKAQLPEDYFTTLENCALETEVQDLMDHYKLYYGGEDVEAQQTTKYKRAIKRDFYRICKKAGIIPFTKFFGISASQFGENLMNNYATHEPIDNDKSPEDLALEYRCNEFSEVESVLRAARYVLAQEIGTDPSVRQSVRVIYEARAEMSTVPTEKGRQLDVFHPYRAVARIQNKPITAFRANPPEGASEAHVEFHETEFLTIMKAQREGFITVKFEIPQDYHDAELLKEMEGLYLSEQHSLISQSWNQQRKQILNDALLHHLYPLLEKDLIQKLTEEARAKVPIAKKVTDLLMAGPFRPPSDEYHETPEDIRIMSCVFGGIKSPTMCIVLDPEGEVVGNLKLGYLTAKPTSKTDNRPTEDLETLKQFIIDHEPHVIALGAEMETRRLYDILHQTCSDLHKERKTHKIHITYVSLDVAHIFGSSPRGKNEFPDFPPLLRQAVSIGRLLRDPLEELTGVLANSAELLSLRLHPLQDMLGEENLTKVVHRCCVNVVNKVGVDINRCIMHKYASPPLQFVAGLGPRKALGLMNNIFKRGGKISSRDDLELYMGHCVYTNCAGFIRILDKYFKKNEDIDLLDNTRIHPDDYNLVKKMATDALEREDDEDLINELMKKPKKLDDIDLEAFADELERNGKPKKRSTLNDIKAEIHDPFSDPRKDLYKDPSPEELFTMLTGETDRTLRNGMLVNAQILAVQPKSIRVKLENGLVGFVKIDNISDDHGSIKDIQQELALEVGMPIFCRILEIQKDRFAVELTCKSSRLSDDTCENEMKRELLIWEPYFVEEDLKRTGLIKKRKKEKPSIIHRKVEHPFFQNVTAQKAEDYLADKDVGEVVIRPSSKGTSYLTITWKFYHDIYVHITIREEGKRNPTSIGQILHIGGEKFEDLNEILARYVEPRMAFAQELYEFRNFRQGSQEEIEAQLREKKKVQPSTIPYLFSVSKEHPGVFVLSYLPNTRVRKEFVNVTSDGFRFRRNIFTDPERLVKWFKTHWKEPVPGPTPRPGDIPEPVVDYGAGEMMNDYDINTMNIQQHPYHQPQQPTWEPQPQAAYSKMIPGQQPWPAAGAWEQPPQQPAPYQNVRPNDRRQHDQRQGNFRGHDRGGRGGGRGRRDDRPRGGERRGPPHNNEGRDNRNYGRDQRSDSGRNEWTSGNWAGSKPAREWDQPPPSNSWEGAPSQTNSSWSDAPTQSTSSWDAQNNYGGSTSSW